MYQILTHVKRYLRIKTLMLINSVDVIGTDTDWSDEMSKKLLSVAVKGKKSVWGFNFYGDPKHLKEWRDDGLDIVEIENIVPEWVVDIGLLKPYVFLQDLFNFKNPFKNKDDTNNILDVRGNDND